MIQYRVYGHKGCPNCAALQSFMKSQGVPFEQHEISYDPPGHEVLRRAAANHPAYEWVDVVAADEAGIDIQSYNPEDLADWLITQPDAIRAPLVVRGSRVVIGNDLGRAQSIMY